MSQGKSKTIPMQIFLGVEAVYYGIVQVVNYPVIRHGYSWFNQSRDDEYMYIRSLWQGRLDFHCSLISGLPSRTAAGNRA